MKSLKNQNRRVSVGGYIQVSVWIYVWRNASLHLKAAAAHGHPTVPGDAEGISVGISHLGV
jgi:hypothetical protein